MKKNINRWFFVTLNWHSYNVGPLSYKLVYKPHEYYSYLRTINHSEIGVIGTNLAIERGPHIVQYVF